MHSVAFAWMKTWFRFNLNIQFNFYLDSSTLAAETLLRKWEREISKSRSNCEFLCFFFFEKSLLFIHFHFPVCCCVSLFDKHFRNLLQWILINLVLKCFNLHDNRNADERARPKIGNKNNFTQEKTQKRIERIDVIVDISDRNENQHKTVGENKATAVDAINRWNWIKTKAKQRMRFPYIFRCWIRFNGLLNGCFSVRHMKLIYRLFLFFAFLLVFIAHFSVALLAFCPFQAINKLTWQFSFRYVSSWFYPIKSA